MAPRANSKKVGLKRIDAAIDALKPMGFSKSLICKTVHDLLKLYGDEGWVFIEEASYKMLIDIMLEDNKEDKALNETVATEVRQRLMDCSEGKTRDNTAGLEVYKQPVDPDEEVDQHNWTPVNLEATSSPVRKRLPCYGWISESEDEDEPEKPLASFEDTTEKSNATEIRVSAAVVKIDEKGKAASGSFSVSGSQVIRKNTQITSFANGYNLATTDNLEGVGDTINPLAAGCQQMEAIGIEEGRTKDLRDAVTAADLLAVNTEQDKIMLERENHIVRIAHTTPKDGRGTTSVATPSITRGPLAADDEQVRNPPAVGNALKEREHAKHYPPLSDDNSKDDNAQDPLVVNRQQRRHSYAGGTLAVGSAHQNIEFDIDCPAVNCEHNKIMDVKSSFAVYDKQARRLLGANERIENTSGHSTADNARSSHAFGNIDKMIEKSDGSSEVATQQKKDKLANDPLASTNEHQKINDGSSEVATQQQTDKLASDPLVSTIAHQKINDDSGCPENNEHKMIKDYRGHPAKHELKKMKDNRGSFEVNERMKDARLPLSVNITKERVKGTSGPAARRQHERVERRDHRGSYAINKQHERVRHDGSPSCINMQRKRSGDTRDYIYNSKDDGRYTSRSSSGIRYNIASSTEHDARGFSASKHDDRRFKEVDRGCFSSKARHDSRNSSGIQYELASSYEDDARHFSAPKHGTGSFKEFARGCLLYGNNQQNFEDFRHSDEITDMKQRCEDSRAYSIFEDKHERMRNSMYHLTNDYDQARFGKRRGNNTDKDKTNEGRGSSRIYITKRPRGWDISSADMPNFD